MRTTGRSTALAIAFLFFLPAAGMPFNSDYREPDRRLAYRAGYDDGYRDGFRRGEWDGSNHARFDLRCRECGNRGMNQFYYREKGHYQKGLRDGYRDGYRSGYRAGASRHHYRR